jgi:hypothetical protein
MERGHIRKGLNPEPHNGEEHGAKVESRRSPFDDNDRNLID